MAELAKIKCDDGKTYFLDLRLKQLRNVENPHDFKDFATESDLDDFLEEHMIDD